MDISWDWPNSQIPECICSISHNAPLIQNRNVAHFCSEWSIVGYRTGAFWDLWNWSNKTVCMPLFTTLDPVVIIGGTTLTWWHIMMEMLHYWPFMKGPVMQIFNIFFCKPKQAVEWWVTDVFFVVCPNKLLNSEFMVLLDTMLLMWCHILILIFVLDLTLNQNHIDQFWVSWLSFQVHKFTLN